VGGFEGRDMVRRGRRRRSCEQATETNESDESAEIIGL
jgi:hypothetical protein